MFGSLFNKRISVDAVVDSILSALTKFDRMLLWGAELSKIKELQIERCNEEMFYLDCFAVYIILKFNDSPGWKQNAEKIFEKVFQGCAINVATTFAGKANATMEEVERAGHEINKRFSVYGPIFERSEGTIKELGAALGVAFSKFCQIEGNAILLQIGSTLFNYRGFELTQFAKENPVSS